MSATAGDFLVSPVSFVGLEQQGLHLDERVLHGPVGDWVEAIKPYVEADRVGIAVSFLVGFGSAVGRSAYVEVGTSRHHANEFALLIGPTASGRKGVAMTSGLRPVLCADEGWSKRVKRGFGSGESIISFLSHPHEENEVNELTADDRLLVHEGEFAQVLTVAARESSTLSSLLRAGWDGDPLENHTMTRGHLEAPNAHLSVLAGITEEELRERVTKTDLANGFLNRFMLVSVRRSQTLPNPPPVPETLDDQHVDAIRAALTFARQHGANLRRDKEADDLWQTAYETELSIDRAGLAGHVCSRAEAHALRLSMLYALLDRSKTIRVDHLQAALALWRYCEQSALLVFGDGTGDHDLDKLLVALVGAGGDGLTRTQINEGVFSRNQPKDRLDSLLARGMQIGRIVGGKTSREGPGRPPERFWLTTHAPKEVRGKTGERLMSKLLPLVREATADASWEQIREQLIKPAETQYRVQLDEAQLQELFDATEPT